MKEYKLCAWPDLPPAYDRMTYHRMLSDLSQRYLSVERLVAASGASRADVRSFLDLLNDHGLLAARDAPASRGSALGRWLRRTLQRNAVEA